MTSSAITGNTSGLASATSPGLVGITTQTFAGAKTFNSGVVIGGNTTADANLGTISSVTNSAYYEGSLSLTFTGPYSQTVTVKYVKTGSMVVLSIPGLSGTSTSASFFTSSTNLPTLLRPTILLTAPCLVNDAGAAQSAPGQCTVNTTGQIQFFKNFSGSGAFTATGSCGGFFPSISYVTF